MTDYSKMDHQQLYDYVQSGDPNAMNHTSQAWQDHASKIQEATDGLQTNLTAIQSQWQGAAADAYFQQSQAVATKMQTHANNAYATSTAVGNTASALSWARNNMPQPPSWLEQETAKIDSSFASGVIGFALGGPGVTVASELAKRDVEEKHQQAISTMTQLAGAYTAAQQQLPASKAGRIDDPSNGNNNNGNNPGDPGNPGATPMPVPVYPVGGSPIGGSPVSVGHGGGYGGGSHAGGGAYGSGFGGGSGGAGGSAGLHDPIPAFHDPGGTSTQGTSFGAGGSGGSLYGGTGMGGGPGGGFGGGAGAGGLGEAGLGAAGLGALGGAAGMGGFGSKAGGTGLGGGEGSGIGAEGGAAKTTGSGSPYGAAARAAAGAAGEGEGAAGAEGQQGMMGGMGGRGGAGGGNSGEERGNRAGFLRQDPDYWYGDKKAAPPGGVIE